MERDLVWLPESEEANRHMAAWVASEIWKGEGRMFAGHVYTLGVFIDDEISAAIVFHDFETKWKRVELSGAAIDPRAWNKEVFRKMGQIAFEFFGMETAIMRTAESAKKLSRVLCHYGFEPHLLPHMRGDEGEIVHIMKKEQFNGW